MIKVEKVVVSVLGNVLGISINYFPKQSEAVWKLVQEDPEFGNLYFDVSDIDTRRFLYHIAETRENVDILVKGIRENNSGVPLMLLGSSYKSMRNFCEVWIKHFDFSEARIHDCR